ncbi:D-alanyl-D-alanine carboxypeptidase family protein [Oenococcus sicerae]|uniref:D-alanyl-D-alanine carboxypeptidase family protein n=1 Tax=Oenococcus sicerae TaxID=2203724 RepID=UPI0026583E26|nr:serine hydrolase [Oenococcus sicerae]
MIGFFINDEVKQEKLSTVNGEPIQLKETANAALVVNFKTGQIVAEQNPKQKLTIASTSKLLTTYLVLKAIRSGKLSWQQRIKSNNEIYRLSQNTELMNVTLYPNDSYTVKQLLESTLLISSNATGVLLGDAISGNQTNFAKLMNKTAASFGIPKSEFKFYNAVGISNSYLGSGKIRDISDKAENLASVKALSTIAYRLFADYPEVMKIMQENQLNFQYPNSSQRFQSIGTLSKFNAEVADTKIKFIAAKSGASRSAGSVMLGLTDKLANGQQYLSVVMNGSDYETPLPTWQLVANMVKEVMNQGTNHVIKKGHAITGSKNLYLQKTQLNQIALKTASTFSFWTNGEGPQRISAQAIPYDRKSAAVKRGQIFTSKINNTKHFDYLYGLDQFHKIKLQATKSTKISHNLFIRYWRWLTH